MEQPVIGFALCGSFCTFGRVLRALEELKPRFPALVPILSEVSGATDTRFGKADDFAARLEAICGRAPLRSLTDVEPIGPKRLLDALVIAPCTGNTLAKLANGVADSAVTLACKAHLRNEAPVVIAVSTNDGLGGNAANLGKLLARKHFYFVPFGQDDPAEKPCSLVADFAKLGDTLAMALEGRQIQPLLLRG
ncbi:MAG: dipicolinate synthase subunit B [Oscillospiraceae bacterium]|nr:dipicolinate synthase subunit B [Oscillospiraceae bacterium]